MIAPSNPRDLLPIYTIIGAAFAILVLLKPNIAAELPLQVQLVLLGVIVLLVLSHELHRMRVNQATNEANTKNRKGKTLSLLPKKFTLKLRTEIKTTPAEFSDALSEVDQR